MAETYMKYDRNTFEAELLKIADANGLLLGDFTEKQGRQHIEERVYEMTTQNPRIRILIYSSIDPHDGQSRDVGGDAVRVNLYCKYDGKHHYKKYKKHQRIETLFVNLNKTIASAQEYVFGEDVKKWFYAISKNN